MFKIIAISILCAIFCIATVSGQVDGISSKLDFGNTDKESDDNAGKSIVQAVVSLRQTSSPSKSVISSKSDQNPFNFHAIATAAEKASEKIKQDFTGISLVCLNGSCNTTDNKTGSKSGELSTDILVQVTTNVKDNEKKEVLKGSDDNSDVPIVIGNSGTSAQNDPLHEAGRRLDVNQDVNIQVTPPSASHGYNYIPYNVNSNVHSRPNSDGIQLQVPHFEPSFNNHYFGETPPPMYVWYKNNRQAGHNPHAFNPNSRPHWQNNRPFSDWQKSHSHHQPTPNTWTPSTICTCTNPGLNWYPSSTSSVDDKMGPLQ